MTDALQPARPRAFAVQFRDLGRWDPGSFHEVRWHWPARVMLPLARLMTRRRDRVDRESVAFSDLQPVTVHFDGTMDRRRVDEGRVYSMDLWYARPGDILVAKIDLKNGAVAIVPEGWTNVVVTGHFAVYEPNRAILVPEYLVRVVQAPFFRRHLWSNKVGAEGRKEVKLSFFESQRIPVPPLLSQRRIVALWHDADRAKEAARTLAAQRRLDLDAEVLERLGIVLRAAPTSPRCFSVAWRDMTRWGVVFNALTALGSAVSTRFPLVPLGDLLGLVQYGTSVKANTERAGTPVLRMSNIVDGRLRFNDIKHVPMTKREVTRLKLQDGDILVNRTNSKELVGKCAVFRGTDTYVFASYLIRLRTDVARADPDYVAMVLNSQFGRRQVGVLSRQIIGQANINSEELRSLRIPLPSVEAQRRLVGEFNQGLAAIEEAMEAADLRAQEATRAAERMILGVTATETS